MKEWLLLLDSFRTLGPKFVQEQLHQIADKRLARMTEPFISCKLPSLRPPLRWRPGETAAQTSPQTRRQRQGREIRGKVWSRYLRRLE